jgi:hypothetical protein
MWSTWFGAILAILLIAPFFRIRLNTINYELYGPVQFIVVLLGLILLMFFFVLKNRHYFMLSIGTGDRLIFAWFLVSTFSAVISDDPILSFKRLFLTFFPAIIVYFSISLNCWPRRVFKGFVFGVSFLTLLNVFYAMSGFLADSWNHGSGLDRATIHMFGTGFSQSLGQRSVVINGRLVELLRFSGFFPNPNGFGLVAATCMVLVLAIKKNINVAYLVLLASIFVGVVLSGSRMAFIFTTVAFAYLFVSSRFDPKTAIVSTIFMVLVAQVAVVVFANSYLLGTLVAGSVLDQEFLSLGERGEILTSVKEFVGTRWVLGAGFGVGAEAVFGNQTGELAIHSVVLNALVETGIIGAGLLVILWGYFALISLDCRDFTFLNPKVGLYISAALIGLFAAQSFDLSITRFHYVNLMFFFLLGFISALQKHGRDNRDREI